MEEQRWEDDAYVEGHVRGVLGVAYEEDNGPGLFEYLRELSNDGTIRGFYAGHIEDEQS